MAYPPRPGMIPPPGIPPPYGMIPPPYGAPPPVGGMRFRGPPPMTTDASRITAPPIMNSNIPSGPPVTVFVGNITERAQDAMVRHLLTTVGPIIAWKRVQGATGRLQAFGFCEYANPDAAARAIRILHDMLIGDKKLVVKVDAKTKDVLDAYKKQRRKNMTGKSPTQEETESNDDNDFMDASMKHEDTLANDRIKAILMDHSKEMAAFVVPDVKKVPKLRDENFQTGPKESLDDVEMEDGKRSIIHREIDKFRETMKIREAEKEEEKKKREKTLGEDVNLQRMSRDRSKASTRRSATRSRSRSFSPIVVGRKSRDRGESRERSSARRSRRPRSRTRSRSRSRERASRDRSSRDRSSRDRTSRDRRERERERDRGGSSRSSKESWKEREKEEEEKEARRAERKARDKEANYQERLRKWESREAKMQKDYEREKNKEAKRLEDMEREANKLRIFLEDYDDDRDDEKYYKGRELERRLQDREREAQRDADDRQKEKDEIEELKSQIAKEGYHDPAAELHRRMAEQMAIPPSSSYENGTIILPPPIPMQNTDDIAVEDDENDEPSLLPPPAYVESLQQQSLIPSVILPPQPGQQDLSSDDDTRDGGGFDEPHMDEDSMDNNDDSNVHKPAAVSAVPAPPQMMKQPLHVSGRKKLDVKDVFNQDDDDGMIVGKKKKLPPLSLDKSSKKEEHKSTEDKRKHIKSLIEKIPTDKNALFEYKVDWDMLDNQLMEKRIRPWVNKKIAEYIGEPEPTLTDFICSKVLNGSTPKAVLEDVQMVLDDEAEVFVVKMWRLLIYEIENKKHKSMSTTSSSSGGANA